MKHVKMAQKIDTESALNEAEVDLECSIVGEVVQKKKMMVK